MPSFANVVPASHIQGLPDSSSSNEAQSFSKQRMIHWSAIKGPLTEGFRKQREKEASKAIVPIAAHLPHSSQRHCGSSEMDSVLPIHFEIVEPLAGTTFEGDDEYEHGIDDALHVYNPTTFRSADAVPYGCRVPRDMAHDVAPPGYQTFDWSPTTAIDQTEMQGLIPHNQAYDNHHVSDSFEPREPNFYPGLDTIPSIGTLTPVEWQTFEPVEPLYQGQHNDSVDYSKEVGPRRKRKRAQNEDRFPSASPPAKTRNRRISSSNANRSLKRKRSGSSALKREKTTSFHEQYIESAKKGDRLLTDLDGWGDIDNEDDDGPRNWSTIDHLKKLGKDQSGNTKTDEEAEGEDLPAVYKTFQPIFKPKMNKNRMIITTNKFKLPIPALNKGNQITDKHQISSASGGLIPKKRSLFQPGPSGPKSTNTIIDILDDEEKKKQKADVLKGLSSSALGLVERPKGKSPVEGEKPAESTEYKSALYRSTKLGNDMEATSSVPFAALEQVNHAEEDWTSSPEGSPMPENGPNENNPKTHESAKPAAGAGTSTLPDPSCKRWTFKLFGRG